MRSIINQEKHSLTDEEIKDLIELYILLDGEFREVYKKIYTPELGEVEEIAELSLDMIPKAITKYIFDNVIEFIEYCDDRQVKIIDDIRKVFAKEIEFAIMKIERVSENSDERKKYENDKASYEKNINLGQIGYGIHIVVVKELISPLREYMAENSQKALPEMVANFRVACQAHGISKQKVGEIQESIENEEQTLSELQQELEKLKKQERRTTQKRDETRLLRNAYQAELDRREEQTH